MTSKELYCKNARVWIPNSVSVWKAAEVLEDYKKGHLKLRTEDAEEIDYEVKSDADLPPLRNPEILIGENDLTSLSYLHEPAVLYNLKVRFVNQNAIYTYCGIVLVAINPYQKLPIYGSDTIFAYRGQAMGDLDPHIFAVAEAAYTQLEKEDRNQSIIVSGESGAGKTVSAKYAMRYFATVGGSATETQIEKKVLASSPIMEAIGNAKTTRNDNSSRFGKYIQLDFNQAYNIIGASMRTYLLEKSRVVFQAPEERNYHIFYQLCASRNCSELKDFFLASADDFQYTNQGENPIITGVSDKEQFEETKSALTLLGFSTKQQQNLFRILCGILHLGNVQIRTNGEEGSTVPKSDKHLLMMTKLLNVNDDHMRMWLCHRKITSMRETFNKQLTEQEAAFARDALAKFIYAELFNWIVNIVNKSLYTSEHGYKFIGVLDIYGFETFEINSFEQFCINYANEKLQQQFNQHVFKLEQEEYMREKIEWKFIDFCDNQPCIDLIESKLGILDLLDEECKMPKGSDQSWVEKLYDKCKKWHHFSKPRLSNLAFIIHHFADNVAYESNGFLEKNRDTIIEEQLNVLKSSQNELVAHLFLDEETKQAVASRKNRTGGKTKVVVRSDSITSTKQTIKQHKKTVGSQFRDSLNLLMTTLNSTTPHYIRCIKPNDEKEAFAFDPKRAVQQLRACGVLETIRISAAGYPSRWTYYDFFLRYRVLCRSKDINRENMKTTSEKILTNVIQAEDQYQFGKSKIFIRAGQVAYLEKLRFDKLRACGVMIQKHIKGWLMRTKYNRLKKATIMFQCRCRGFLARRHARHLRETNAAIIIQKHVRGFVKRSQFLRAKRTVLVLQAHIRGMKARKVYMEKYRNAKARIIQKHVRGFLARVAFKRDMRRVVICQSAVRRFLARRQLKKLKVEARSVEHMKKLNKGLENKIISLQQKNNVLLKDNNNLKTSQNEYNAMKTQIVTLKQLEADHKLVSIRIIEVEEIVKNLRIKLNHEKEEKMDIIYEKDQLEKAHAELQENLTKENDHLQEELEQARECIALQEKEAEEILRKRLEQEKYLLNTEFDQERTSYQKLLKDYHMLEQKNEHLGEELNYFRNDNGAQNQSSLSAMSSMVSDNDSYSTSSTLPLINNEQVDVGLVLKLQQKLVESEKERSRVEKRVEELEKDETLYEDPQRTQELLRMPELEIENAKLKESLSNLRQSVADANPGNEKANMILIEQFEALQAEVERRRDESIQLRSVLANKTHDFKQVAKSYPGKDVDIINEDGELIMAFQSQKQIILQLESELHTEKKKNKNIESEFKVEIEKLKGDNERQQKLLSQNLTRTPQSQTEAFMQHEIARLTGENLDLREKVDSLSEQLKKYKKQLKIYAKKIKDPGYEGIPDTGEMKPSKDRDLQAVVRKMTREYLGMFEYSKDDENSIIKNLIFELKPRIAINLLPGLPAYILFMCIRHTDFINDDQKVKSLLTNTINALKRIIKKRHEDLDVTVLWLANTLRLLHNLKQYSGDKAFQTDNTPKQNDQCLRNFDLSEYRQVLSDIAVWIYQGVIKIMEENVQPVIVPAILEHEAISGLSGQRPGGRGRTASVTQEPHLPTDAQQAVTELLRELTNFYNLLAVHGVDPELITQVFKQIFYFICAGALNNLLLRKDLCHWTKGMQIRYNLSNLEQWLRDKKLQDGGVSETLEPIIQAAQLLQARKSDEDVKSICDMCDKLSVFQIIKILNLYTPADEFEERVPVSFIRKIQDELHKRMSANKQANGMALGEPKQGPEHSGTVLMDTKFAYPVRFPFNPSNIRLEDVEIPEVLNLPFVKKV